MPETHIPNNRNLRLLPMVCLAAGMLSVVFICILYPVMFSIALFPALAGAIVVGALRLIRSHMDQVNRDLQKRPVLVRVSKQTFPRRHPNSRDH